MTDSRRRVLAMTGAGISAESGIPTFRGRHGYWRNLDPTKLATAAAFAKDPEMVWDWYRERRALIHRSKPNAAHQTLARLAAESGSFLLLTQNVDDLHARSTWNGGPLSGDALVQIHGDIFVTRCTQCDYSRRETAEDARGVPLCSRCGGAMRPGVVWFDEELPSREVRRIECFVSRSPCDLVLVIGTTANFDYIIDWARRAKGHNGHLIEINPEETEMSRFASEVIREPAAIALPRLFNS